MKIEFSCGQCGQRFVVEEGLAGRRVRCRKCGQALTVPAAPAPAAAEGDDWSALAEAAEAERRAPVMDAPVMDAPAALMQAPVATPAARAPRGSGGAVPSGGVGRWVRDHKRHVLAGLAVLLVAAGRLGELLNALAFMLLVTGGLVLLVWGAMGTLLAWARDPTPNKLLKAVFIPFWPAFHMLSNLDLYGRPLGRQLTALVVMAVAMVMMLRPPEGRASIPGAPNAGNVRRVEGARGGADEAAAYDPALAVSSPGPGGAAGVAQSTPGGPPRGPGPSGAPQKIVGYLVRVPDYIRGYDAPKAEVEVVPAEGGGSELRVALDGQGYAVRLPPGTQPLKKWNRGGYVRFVGPGTRNVGEVQLEVFLRKDTDRQVPAVVHFTPDGRHTVPEFPDGGAGFLMKPDEQPQIQKVNGLTFVCVETLSRENWHHFYWVAYDGKVAVVMEGRSVLEKPAMAQTVRTHMATVRRVTSGP